MEIVYLTYSSRLIKQADLEIHNTGKYKPLIIVFELISALVHSFRRKFSFFQIKKGICHGTELVWQPQAIRLL